MPRTIAAILGSLILRKGYNSCGYVIMRTPQKNIVPWVVIILSVLTLPLHIYGQENEHQSSGYLSPQPSSLAPGIRIRPYLGFGIVTGNFDVDRQDYFVKSSPSITVGFKALYSFGGDWVGFSLGINTGLHGTFGSRIITKHKNFAKHEDSPDYWYQQGKYLRQRIAYWGPSIAFKSKNKPLAFSLSFTRSWTSWDTNQFDDDEAEGWEFVEHRDSSMGLLISVSYRIITLGYSFHVSRAELFKIFPSQREYRMQITSRTNWIYLAISLQQ